MWNKIKNDNSGFNLAELLIAVAVLVVSTSAIMSLVNSNIRAQSKNEDYLVASMLAQEGLELVRNLRDKNWLDSDVTKAFGNPWYDIAEDGNAADVALHGSFDGDFVVDYTYFQNHNISDVDADDNIVEEAGTRLYMNGGFYDHDNTGVATKYHRLITITNITLDSIEVTAHVQWAGKVGRNHYKASTYLYAWR